MVVVRGLPPNAGKSRHHAIPFVNVVLQVKQVLPPIREECKNPLSNSKEAPLTAGPVLPPDWDGPKKC